jgi:hypothetical protein
MSNSKHLRISLLKSYRPSLTVLNSKTLMLEKVERCRCSGRKLDNHCSMYGLWWCSNCWGCVPDEDIENEYYEDKK